MGRAAWTAAYTRPSSKRRPPLLLELAEPVGEHGLRHAADQRVHPLTLLEEQQRREGLHAESLRDGGLGLDVHLADRGRAGPLARQVADHGGAHLGGAAPGGPGVQQVGTGRLRQGRVESGRGDVDRAVIAHERSPRALWMSPCPGRILSGRGSAVSTSSARACGRLVSSLPSVHLPERSRRLVPPREELIAVGATKVHVVIGGQGDPLVVLHGAGGKRGWRRWMAAVGERYTVYAPTHPGFGRSDTADWMESIHDLARFYLWFFDVMGLSRVHLLGHSIGGWTAAELATMGPGGIDPPGVGGPRGLK